MTTFSEMSIPVLTLVVKGLILVKDGCDRRVQQLESEGTDNATMLNAVNQLCQVSELLMVAQTDLNSLNRL